MTAKGMRGLEMVCLGFAFGVLMKATAEPNGQNQNQNQSQIQSQRPNPTALTWGNRRGEGLTVSEANSRANGLQTGP
jgi:hypothetical protein